MRVLVTGGAGFIGSHIVTALHRAGHEPVVLDALLPSAHPTAPDPPTPGSPAAEFLHADVRDPSRVRAALRGVDAVCHQAAMVGLGKDFADAPAHVGCNDLGTAVLLAAMAEAGVRSLVLAGSMVVYGEGRYECPSHGVVRPGARRPEDLAAGRFEPGCPGWLGVALAGAVAYLAVPVAGGWVVTASYGPAAVAVCAGWWRRRAPVQEVPDMPSGRTASVPRP